MYQIDNLPYDFIIAKELTVKSSNIFASFI